MPLRRQGLVLYAQHISRAVHSGNRGAWGVSAVATGPAIWSVPKEWPGERCFVICGGESVRQQKKQIARLKGRLIVVKHGVLLRPDADAMFLTAETWDALPLLPKFKGTYAVGRRGRESECAQFPPSVKWLTRTKDHEHLCDLPTHVCGYDAGTSAINLAYHFGAKEIVLLGYDMTGGRWFCDERGKGEWSHPMPRIPEQHFKRHMAPLYALAADAKAKGIRIVNCSPISRVTAFEKQPLEKFL
jgi:hypothetical protein